MNSEQLLSRLQEDSRQTGLTRILLDQFLSRPIDEILPPEWLARSVIVIVKHWASSKTTLAEWEKQWNTLQQAASKDNRPLANIAPSPLQDSAFQLLRLPLTPSRKLVEAFLEAPPLRAWAEETLHEVLIEFGRKLKSPVADTSVGKSLSGLAKLAVDQAKSRAGTLGALASGVVGAVSSEVERQWEKRANEFVAEALEQVFARLLDALTNPVHLEKQLQLREAFFEQLLGLSPAQWASESRQLDVSGVLSLLQEGLRRWTDTPGSEEALAQFLKAHVPSMPISQFLEAHGVLEAFQEACLPLFKQNLSSIFEAPAFSKWLTDVMAD